MHHTHCLHCLWLPTYSSSNIRCALRRLQLGLWEKPQADVDAGSLDVRPRWPLTDRRDSRSMPAEKSMRKSRIFTSLTDLTAEALRSNQQTEAAAAIL